MHFALAIVAIIVVMSLIRHHQGRPSLMMAQDPEARDRAALVDEIAALNGRIAVLERIITENRSSQSLAHEIEALR